MIGIFLLSRSLDDTNSQQEHKVNEWTVSQDWHTRLLSNIQCLSHFTNTTVSCTIIANKYMSLIKSLSTRKSHTCMHTVSIQAIFLCYQDLNWL